MASITRKPTSPYWIACFTDHSGIQRQRSTKENDRTEALKRAQEFEALSRGRPSEAHVRKVLGDIYERAHGEKLPLESIETYLESWLRRKAPETKPGTSARYVTAVRKFLAFLGARSHREIGLIHSRDILGFRDHVAKNLSSSSANTDLKILRIALGQAWQDGLITTNVARQVALLKRIQSSDVRRRPFTAEELKRLLDVAGSEWRGIILAGFYTGQRLGDIVRLKWHQVDLKASEIRFLTGKTGRVVLLWIAPPLHKYLSELPSTISADALVFPSAYALVQKSKGDTRRLSAQFHDLMVKASIVLKRSKVNTGKGHSGRRQVSPLSFHSLRHTTTSMLKNAGVSAAVAMDIVGHESNEISWNYTHIDQAAKRAAIELLPRIA